MAVVSLQGTHYNHLKAVQRIGQELQLLDDVYAAPLRQGISHHVPEYVAELLTDRRDYLTTWRDFLQDNHEPANAALAHLATLESLTAFLKTCSIIHAPADTSTIDLADGLLTHNGDPHFIWRPDPAVILKMQNLEDIPSAQFKERILGPLKDTRTNVHPHPADHLLAFRLTDVNPSYTCKLDVKISQFAVDLNGTVKDVHTVEFHVAPADIHSAIQGTKCSVAEAFDDLEKYGVTRSRLRYYVAHSNLSAAYRNSLRVFTEFAYRSDQPTDWRDIFDLHEPRKNKTRSYILKAHHAVNAFFNWLLKLNK